MYRTILILFTLVIAGCGTSDLVNLSQSKKDIALYYEAGAYENEMKEIVNKAISRLNKLPYQDSMAVVFDIDETALDNYDYIKSIDFGYIEDDWDEWIQKAAAPPVAEVKRLYEFLLSKKYHIIFITGRTEKQVDATRRNLELAGYTKYDTLIVRTPGMENAPASNYKSIERIMLNSRGYKIIASVGDQISDLKGEYTGIPVKLPNYLYTID